MFEQQESTPWYRSLSGLITASLILPPIGLLLLWMRRDAATRVKILGTLGILLLTAGYYYAFNTWSRSRGYEAHYALLEQNRAQQHAQASSGANSGPGNGQPAATLNAPQQSAVASPQPANGQPANSLTSAGTASAHASRN